MKNFILKHRVLIPAVLAGLFVGGIIALLSVQSPKLTTNNEDFTTGASSPRSNWTTIKAFNGFYTKLDETKIPDGANGRGQNTTSNQGDRISIRNQGTELFPVTDTASTTIQRISSMHNFRLKDGTNILMRSRSTFLEYFEETGDVWTIIKGGYTSDQVFGFADYNKTTEIATDTIAIKVTDLQENYDNITFEVKDGANSLGTACADASGNAILNMCCATTTPCVFICSGTSSLNQLCAHGVRYL